jgi:hypothetical protein
VAVVRKDYPVALTEDGVGFPRPWRAHLDPTSRILTEAAVSLIPGSLLGRSLMSWLGDNPDTHCYCSEL